MPHVYVDADDCAVKDEIYKVAKRYGLSVTLATNQWMHTPEDPRIRLEVVGNGLDAADDWIVEHVQRDDIVICTDVPLASRCIAKGARVINARGQRVTENDIGGVLATRDLLHQLREAGVMTGGPKPFGPKDRSNFLQALDREVHAARKSRRIRGLS